MTYYLHCKYCGHTQDWKFEPEPDFETMEDIIDYDYEYLCNQCGCSVRVSDALNIADMENLGYGGIL